MFPVDIILILRSTGLFPFDLNGSRQVVPNYAVPKMNTSTMSGICAANNSLVLSNKSYYSWTTSSGGKYTWMVNNGRIGWVASESLLAENTNQKGTNYKWEISQGKSFQKLLVTLCNTYHINRYDNINYVCIC